MSMTWKEFKELIDTQITGNEEIMYIDISYPTLPLNIEVEENGLKITD